MVYGAREPTELHFLSSSCLAYIAMLHSTVKVELLRDSSLDAKLSVAEFSVGKKS
jgi:hypothetical protein